MIRAARRAAARPACRRRRSGRAGAGRGRCRPPSATAPFSERRDGLLDRLRPKQLQPSPSRAPARSASSISSRVIGSERTSAPVASRIALAIAAAVGMIGGSPSPFEPRFVRCVSGSSIELADDLGHVRDRRAACRRRESASARRRLPGSSRRCSESVCPIACTIPPSTWLRAPSGLRIRPTSWIGGDPLDADLARLDVDRHLGHLNAEREHAHAGRIRAACAGAEDLRALEQVRAGRRSAKRRRRSRRRCRPSATASAARDASAARRARGSAARRRRRRRARPGPSRESSTEPAERVAYGPRAVSPSSTVTRSSGRPSSSAAICAIAVREPVPMSCIAVTTVARASEVTRTHAYEGGPPPPYQTWLASPTPCFHVSVERARTSCRRSQCGSRAAVALEQVLRGERPPVEEVGVGVIPPPELERVELELRRELVEQALEAERALDEARARGRRPSAPELSFAPCSVVATLSQA